MAPRYPSIPEPTLEPTSLRDSILAIKQMLEILTGQRGNPEYGAVMPGDLATKVSKSGDTMTGSLSLSGNPTLALEAAPKQYVDTQVSSAMAEGGMQVNGGMSVWQGVSAVGVPSGTGYAFVADGWKVEKTGTSVISAYQYTTTDGPPGFNQAIQMQASTPQASIGSDYVRWTTNIEGWRVSRVAWGTPFAMPVTVGFWMRASFTGTYRIIITNYNGSAATGWMTFTINASLVWQWVTVTFPAQTTGTWYKDNNVGMYVAIEVASSATPNNISAINQYASLTGFIMLPGSQVPSEAMSRFVARSFDQELLLCQRYYWKSFPYATPPAQNSGVTGNINYIVTNGGTSYAGVQVQLPTTMRATPTIVTYNPNAANSKWRNVSLGADSGPVAVGATGEDRFMLINATQVAGDLVAHTINVHATADARI